jgi:hypothetical protein
LRIQAELKTGQLLQTTEKAKRGPDKIDGQGSQRARSEAKTLKQFGVSETTEKANGGDRGGRKPKDPGRVRGSNGTTTKTLAQHRRGTLRLRDAAPSSESKPS